MIFYFYKLLFTVNRIFKSADWSVQMVTIDIFPLARVYDPLASKGYDAGLVAVRVVRISMNPVSDLDLFSVCDINEVFAIFRSAHSQPAGYFQIELIEFIELCFVVKISKVAAEKSTHFFRAFRCHERVDWHLDEASTRRWNCCCVVCCC